MTRPSAQLEPDGSLDSSLFGRQARTLALIEEWLDRTLPHPGSPPSRLHLAMREAVFPGGKRARPALVCMVAELHGAGGAELAGRMAAAVELVHCASLVHDDLPAFDNAEERRGKPSCHAMFGEATGILVGDALLTLAFEVLASSPLVEAERAMRLTRLLADATGSRSGIIGGQGLELQTNVDLDAYHMQKTSALFRAAAGGGALAAGADADLARWLRFGELIGRALQLADDLDDCLSSAEVCGKPVGQDALFDRPNAALRFGVDEVRRTLGQTVTEAVGLLGTPSLATEPLRALVHLISARHLAAATAGH
ncbi:MAG: polyprenyl synthetase family protein [Myxococcales bacterium]|nr:polyprenyl synthetase family protein [Myxococcales bacterium]